MSELQAWALLTGFFLPPLVAIVQQPRWSASLRSFVTVAISAIVGLVETWLVHELHFDEHLLATLAQVTVAAQASYLAFWKRQEFTHKIELATSTEGHAHD